MSCVENVTYEIIGKVTLYRIYMNDILVIYDKEFDAAQVLDKFSGVRKDNVLMRKKLIIDCPFDILFLVEWRVKLKGGPLIEGQPRPINI